MEIDVADSILGLWSVIFGLGVVACLAGVILLVRSVMQQQSTGETQESTFAAMRRLALSGGIMVPVGVVAVVLGLALQSANATSSEPEPAEPQSTNQTELPEWSGVTIEIIGHQWWWEVRYPDFGFETANEIHIPTGQRVHLELTSADVIHSFWVPRLAGKIDLINGHLNTMWISAEEPGVYQGQCAEFCGKQHAMMKFNVHAQTPDEFANWVEEQRQPIDVPEGSALAKAEETFVNAACAGCHTVRGTDAQGTIGPDLTHVASRDTIVSATQSNTRRHMWQWVNHPQQVKPGNVMPNVPLSEQELNLILTYLMAGLE